MLIFTFLYPSVAVTASRPRISNSLLLASQTSTPRLTPPGSPPISSASVSPTRTSKPVSPKRHSMSFSVSRGMFDRTSMYSPVSSNHSSVSSPHAGAHTGLLLKLSPLQICSLELCWWLYILEIFRNWLVYLPNENLKKRTTLVGYSAISIRESCSVFFSYPSYLMVLHVPFTHLSGFTLKKNHKKKLVSK